MLLKILWLLDAFILLTLVAGIFVEQPEKGKFAYIFLYIILMIASYSMKETYPKAAIFIASIPVIIPILIILFLFIVFNISAALK